MLQEEEREYFWYRFNIQKKKIEAKGIEIQFQDLQEDFKILLRNSLVLSSFPCYSEIHSPNSITTSSASLSSSSSTHHNASSELVLVPAPPPQKVRCLVDSPESLFPRPLSPSIVHHVLVPLVLYCYHAHHGGGTWRVISRWMVGLPGSPAVED